MSTTTDLTKNYSGLLGNLIHVKSRKSKSIITIPGPKPPSIPTGNQVEARERFVKAAVYAKNALQNPDMLAAYTACERNGLTANIMAMTDYLKPPCVDEMDVLGYHGHPGDKIGVEATDDFGLSSVTVKITGADGILIEEGDCTTNSITGDYQFTATVEVPDLTGVTITAKATEMSGHSDQLSVTL